MARAAERLAAERLADERLMDWLCDAHDMEKQAETFLQFLADRIDFPALKEELSRHCELTRNQAGRILASFIFNHIKRMEVAAYAMLIAAADDVGDRETAKVCGEILAEEQAMASRVGKRLPPMLA